MKIHKSFGFILLVVLLFGCKTAEEGVEIVREIAVPAADALASDTGNDPEPELSDPPSVRKELEEPQEPEPEDPIEEEEAFTVTEEVYNQTFSEVEQVIKDLNNIIQQNDFETWKTFLTERYIDVISDEEKLKELSNNPILKQENIELKTLEDYFRHVVVPARSKPRLDQIEFLDEKRVLAITVIRGKKYILYQLIYRDGKWKITVF
ncbi:MAG: hypothetical protein ACLFSE_09380 [Spirochaetia bacterium]